VDRAIADLFHGGAAQVIAQFGVPSQDDRERAAVVGHYFHEPLEADERLQMQVVRLIDDQYDRLTAAADLAQRALAFLAMSRNLGVLVGGEVMEVGHVGRLGIIIPALEA
jgi:hypothetical protein